MTAYGLSCPSVLGSLSVFALDIASGGHKAHKRPSGGLPWSKKFRRRNFDAPASVSPLRANAAAPAPVLINRGSLLQGMVRFRTSYVHRSKWHVATRRNPLGLKSPNPRRKAEIFDSIEVIKPPELRVFSDSLALLPVGQSAGSGECP